MVQNLFPSTGIDDVGVAAVVVVGGFVDVAVV